jgi:2-polyprenyl-3-methyl-5-hydroxy-6-metoxy-1,4-benzoquinol methylase
MDADSLERLVPDRVGQQEVTGQETLALHLERYAFAATHARGRVLDAACGVGYGTRLLRDRGADVEAVGVDLSQEAVEYARERYGDERTRFVCSDALQFQDDAGFDTIVSLETIEHVPDPGALVDHLVGLLRPGGVLVASVPVTPTTDINPHHLHDFTSRSFRHMLQPHGLEEIGAKTQVQNANPVTAFARKEARLRDVRSGLPGYYLSHPGALVRRIASTLRHGFTFHYLTIAWRRPAEPTA